MMRERKLATFAVAAFVLSACAKNAVTPTSPSSVDVGKVQAVLIARTDAEAAACEAEIVASGGNVLYRGESHLLLADRPPASLVLKQCAATVTANERTQLAAAKTDASQSRSMEDVLRLIPAEDIGARTFVKANPSFDGRGIIVAILDTGVEVDHPMLRKTSTGSRKVVDTQDFSGEGRVALGAVAADGNGALDGTAAGYSAAGIAGELRFGIFAGSTLRYSEDVAEKDEFIDVGVLAYATADGWRARVDLDGDKNFANEEEIFDFAKSDRFVKLGAKKTMTATVNVASDGSSATVVFDDGTHGSHVAGITAGFDPNGLTGVAPGAQILSAKIGDNRLSGGSTTTASMLLAIDYAVAKGARVINLSYGIRAGSNVGQSAIARYVDTVARTKGMIFSISAGNEGPGLLTIGTPAEASLAITNGAYVSPATAKENYGYMGMDQETVWWFSSMGPRFDGGLKPTLLAPGSALSSVPLWAGQQANFRGTSMASPHTTGGLALLLSAAEQSSVAMDRVAVTRAVYGSARKIAHLPLIAQGHGLFQVPAAWERLQATQKDARVEFTVAAASPASPEGTGAGIFVRSPRLPSGGLPVTITPVFGRGATAEEQTTLHTYRLVSSAAWIQTPATLWMGSTARTFQVTIDSAVLRQPGLHSESVTGIDEGGRTAFIVPVTVISAQKIGDENLHQLELATSVPVAQTIRHFIDVPAGTTALQVDLESDGPALWLQLLDPEGRHVLGLDDPARPSPLPTLRGEVAIMRPGVYEIDVVAPPTNANAAKARVKVRAYSLTMTTDGDLPEGGKRIVLQNNFEAVRVIADVETRLGRRSRVIPVEGEKVIIPFDLDNATREAFERFDYTVVTAKTYYDLMTDYPFRIFDPLKNLVGSGALELRSTFALEDLTGRATGTYALEIQGAFTKDVPGTWTFQLLEDRVLPQAIAGRRGKATSLETGAFLTVDAVMPLGAEKAFATSPGFAPCMTVAVRSADGRKIQDIDLCR